MMIRCLLFVLCSIPVYLHSQWGWTGPIKSDTIGVYVCRYNEVTHSDNDTILYNFTIYCGPRSDNFDREYDLGSELDTFVKLLEQLTLESDSFNTSLIIDKPHFKMSIADHHLEIPTWFNGAKCMVYLTFDETMELISWLYLIRVDNINRPRKTIKEKR